ncbi:hypothetical protein ACJRO7_007141 [Eucalyptus globulus]|uniref:Uncharacterized protein n=1 Tax=Eucalyptus globulus TaxID=34317 RepID=A0ABD3IP49_EUCGL
MRLLCLLALIPLAAAECTCDKDDEGSNKSQALKYKLAAIASILVAGTVGVCLPILGKTVPALNPERSIFFIIKAFAAGVILSTGLIHVLPDAFEKLTSPCLSERPWGEFPFAGFVAMLGALGTLMVDTVATSYFKKLHADNAGSDKSVGDEERARENQGQVPVHTHATHGHSHGPISTDAESDLLRHRVISQVDFRIRNLGTSVSLDLFSIMHIFQLAFFFLPLLGAGAGDRGALGDYRGLTGGFGESKDHQASCCCLVLSPVL